MAHDFKNADGMFARSVICGDFESRDEAHAFARSWLAERGYSILADDIDAENDAVDIMAARGSAMAQFAIEIHS